ncbi:hypothetical protein CR513_16498, partial [Mucuna pruriens]
MRNVKSFHGIARDFRHFVKNFNTQATPINKIVKNNKKRVEFFKEVIRLQNPIVSNRESMFLISSTTSHTPFELVYGFNPLTPPPLNLLCLPSMNAMLNVDGDLVWVHLRKERFPNSRKYKLLPRGDDIQEEKEAKGNQALKGLMARGRLRRLQEEVLQKLGVLRSLENRPKPKPKLKPNYILYISLLLNFLE